jgi:hypothetical protein
MDINIVDLIPGENNKKKVAIRISTLLCTILSFLLSMALVGLALLFVVQWSCFRENTLLQNLISSKYYENVRLDIHTKADAITLPSGLSLEVLNNTIELNEIRHDVNGYMEAGFQGEDYEADTTLIELKLEHNIDAYLSTVGITPNMEQKSNIEYYVKSIAAEYKNSIKIPLLSFLISISEEYNEIYLFGSIICIGVIVFIFFMIIKLKAVHPAFHYIAYSTTAAAIMIALAPAIALFSGFYKRIQLTPWYYYNFAMIFVTNILQTFLLFSLGLALISIALILCNFIAIKPES